MNGLVEVVPIGDTLCSGIGKIESIDGGLLRLWLYVLQISDETGDQERVLVAKIVAPRSAIPDAILQMVAAITDRMPTLAPIIADMLN